MTYDPKTHYSEHFSHKELRCHCGCTPSPEVDANLKTLAGHLEELRIQVGAPLHINDAHRCPDENIRVGGAKVSQHLFGRAADIDTGALSNATFASRAAHVPAFNGGGIGTYPKQHFVHVDYRGYTARWSE